MVWVCPPFGHFVTKLFIQFLPCGVIVRQQRAVASGKRKPYIPVVPYQGLVLRFCRIVPHGRGMQLDAPDFPVIVQLEDGQAVAGDLYILTVRIVEAKEKAVLVGGFALLFVGVRHRHRAFCSCCTDIIQSVVAGILYKWRGCLKSDCSESVGICAEFAACGETGSALPACVFFEGRDSSERKVSLSPEGGERRNRDKRES